MFDLHNIFVPNSEEEENSENGAAHEGDIPCDDREERRDENVHVVAGRLVGTGEAGVQLVLQLVEVAQVDPAVLAPPTHAQAPWLSLDYLGVVEETVEDLPQQDHRHQN